MLNKNFLNFSVKLLLKEKGDYLFSFIIFGFIIFIVTSVLLISESIKRDLLVALQNEGQIIVKNTKGGRYYPLNDNHIDSLLQVSGVDDVIGKVDGYYNFAQDRRFFKIAVDDDLNDTSMVVSKDIYKILKDFKYEKEFNFLIPPKNKLTLQIKDVIDSTIISNNTIFVNEYIARQILQMEEDEYSYLDIVVPNSDEIENIALIIPRIFPNFLVLPNYEIEADYDHLYYYKGGIFMILYIVALISFFILLKNQISSVYGSKRKEIAILRSIGFSIKDIISLKFIQNFLVTVGAYFTALMLSYAYVFVFNAPLLRNIFLGEIEKEVVFTPIFDLKMLVLIFIFTVVPYLASILIPSWRLAIEDVSEAMK